VVHGGPGIVSAIDSTTDPEVKKAAKGLNLRDERKTANGYSEENASAYSTCSNKIEAHNGGWEC